MNHLFKALNDDTRRQILEFLKEGELNAGDIAARFQMSRPSISHHLDLLRQAGLIEAERRGQFIVYSLNTTVVDELLAWMIKLSSKIQPSTANQSPKISGK